MSTQQILNIDTSTLSEKFTNEIIFNADQYYFEKHFKMGKGMDIKKALHYSKLQSIICTDNCELSGWIKKKLEGKLEELGVCPPKKRTLQNLLQIIQNNTNCKTQTEIICECLN